MGTGVAFYGEVDLFASDTLMAHVKDIMDRAVASGTTDFIFFDGTYLDTLLRRVKCEGITKHFVSFRGLQPPEVSVTYLADLDWLYKFADYVVVINTKQPEKRYNKRILWLHPDTLKEQWL